MSIHNGEQWVNNDSHESIFILTNIDYGQSCDDILDDIRIKQRNICRKLISSSLSSDVSRILVAPKA